MDTGGGFLISVFGLFQYLHQAFFASIKVSVLEKRTGETTFYQEARKRSQALPEQATFLLSIVSYCDLFWHYSMAVACEPMREEIDSAQIPTIFLVNKMLQIKEWTSGPVRYTKGREFAQPPFVPPNKSLAGSFVLYIVC